MKRWGWSVVAAVVLLAAVLVPAVGADEAGKRPSVVRPSEVWYPTAFAVTPPLKDLPPVVPGVQGPPREVPNRPVNPLELPVLTFPGGEVPKGEAQGEGALSGSTGVHAPAPSVSFASLGSDHNQSIVGFRVAPPDTQGAVGPNHYIQWVNLVWAVYNKSGVVVGGPWAGNSLWQALPAGSPCRTANDGDPITLYDHGADRWFMSQFRVGSSPYYTCLAVSQTPDPLGPWYVWQYLYSNTLMNDYPKFGVWPDGYYMTVNEFGSGQSATTVFDRAAMLAGAASPAAVYFQIEAVQPAFPQPTHWDGGPPPPPGSPNYNIAFYDDGWGNPFDLLQICSFVVNWGAPGSSTFTCPAGWTDPGIINLTAAGLSFDSNLCGYNRNCIPQQGTTQLLDALSDRLMFPANYRNLLGTLGYEVMVLTHSVDANGADRAGVRWYELRKYPGNPWTVHTGGTFSPDAHHRWMGSAAVDQNGNIGLVYSVSSSSLFPSVRYTGRLRTDPPGFMDVEATAVAGGGFQSGVNRWGDYASIHTDPDGCTFWGTAEYVASSGSFDWDTWVVAFSMPGCTPSGFGTLAGTVINANTSAPIAGALVQAGAYSTTTQSNGTYSMNLPVGTYSVTASKFGFAPQTVPGVEVTDGATTTQNFALTPTAVAELDGFVMGQPHGWPLYAKVDLKVGSSLVASTFTNPFNGYYYFASLPALQNYDIEVTSQIPGYKLGARTILLSATGQTENFGLAPTATSQFVRCKLQGGLNEAFEGTWPPEGWTVTHDSGRATCLWTNVSARSNLTGGTGKFAIADSDACGSGSTMGTSLISPIIDLSGIPNVGLRFKYDYYHMGTQAGYVDVSSDGGTTWTTIMTFNTTAHRGPRTYEADLSAQWGNNANARLRFRFVSPAWNWWWMIDDVRTIVPRAAPVLYENFDSTTFPPSGWSNFNVDGGGTTWARTTTSPYNPAGAAWHNLSTVGMQNGWLATPTITLPSPAAELSFWERATSIPNYFKHSIWVCTTGCTSPPTNWTEVANLGPATASWALRTVSLNAYAGQAVRLAFRYEGNNGDAWFIDEIRVGVPNPPTYLNPTGFLCTPIAGTLVAGFVTDGNTGNPINGARVENDLGGVTTTFATPADPAVADGFYWLFTPLPGGLGPATRTFTASFPGYGNDVKQAILPPNTTYRLDFALPAGWLTVNPLSLYSRLYHGQEEHQLLNLNNQGGLPVTFQLLTTVKNPSWPHLTPQFPQPQPLVPEGPAQLATDTRGLNLPPAKPSAPWTAGAVIRSWATGLTLPWGTGYDQLGDKVWASNPAAGGGDDKNHEYLPNGTKTTRTVSALFGGSWAADLAFDPFTNRLWQVNVGGDNCIYEINPTVPAPTGQKICYGATTSERGLAYDPMTDTFFIGGWNTQTIRRFNRAGTVVASKNVGLAISGLAYNPATDHLFVMTNAVPNLVYVLDVGNNFAVLGSFGVAGFGDYTGAGLEFDCAGNLWAANQTDKKMYQFSSGETGSCPWAGGPPWLVLTPTSGSVGPYSTMGVDAHFIADGAPRLGTYQAEVMTVHNSANSVPKVNVCFIKAFHDVPQGYWADRFVHAVAGARITSGAGGNFRPDDVMTRGTMARWLLLGRYGNTYSPPPCEPIFADVDCDSTPNASWIVDLYNKGITAGCGTNPLRYCPDQPVTRGAMAIFLLRAKEPAGYTPPACTGTMFGDVDCSRFRDAWIEELARRGISSGCGGGNYCPDNPTTRAQQSVFVTRTWNIPRCP